MNALIIARFTLHEAARRRLILAGAVISILFLGLFALGFNFMYGMAAQNAARRPANAALELAASGSLLTTLGLYAIYFLSSFLALFLSVGSVSGEIDSGALHAVLARPLRRAEFVLGRWLAFVGLVAAYVGLMSLLLLLVARLIAGYDAPDPARAIGLMALGSVALLTVSLFGSTVLPTLANGVVVFTLFGLAWLAGIIEYLGGLMDNDAMLNLGIVVSLLIPSDAVWRGASFYVQSPMFLAMTAARGGVPFAGVAPPSLPLLVWATAYPLLFLAAAAWAFSRRDL